MSEPSAKVICDSISPTGDRLTTMEVVMHRFVLAEFNTHRMFSRNSESSRAVPLHKKLDRVKNDLAVPVVWASEQSGMTGGDELDEKGIRYAEIAWQNAAKAGSYWAKYLAELGVHKSICNRLIEPFLWQTVIVTATEWDGFWWQRCDENAQPEMRAAAEAMHTAYANSDPDPVGLDSWHLPYVRGVDYDELVAEGYNAGYISAARCARVSYLTQDGVRDPLKDLELYDRLALREGHHGGIDFAVQPLHASPLEHVATPHQSGELRGNFHGWDQLRHIKLGF